MNVRVLCVGASSSPLVCPLQGDYIDTTLGVTLGISTMAAAALGNWISDLSGIGYGTIYLIWEWNCFMVCQVPFPSL